MRQFKHGKFLCKKAISFLLYTKHQTNSSPQFSFARPPPNNSLAFSPILCYVYVVILLLMLLFLRSILLFPTILKE